MKTEEISVRTRSRIDSIDITEMIEEFVGKSNVRSGILLVYVPHTSAGVIINEHYDKTVIRDIQEALKNMVPEIGFEHLEGNSDAHIKTALVGNSQMLIVEDGKLKLGTWQRVLFLEFDGPRNRKVFLKFISDK